MASSLKTDKGEPATGTQLDRQHPAYAEVQAGRSYMGLAMLVLGHRGKLDKVAVLPKVDVNWLLILFLRLAVLFHRSRSDQGRPPYSIAMGDKGATLELPADWLAANPLTAAAFAEEIQAWQRAGLEFRLKRLNAAKGGGRQAA